MKNMPLTRRLFSTSLATAAIASCWKNANGNDDVPAADIPIHGEESALTQPVDAMLREFVDKQNVPGAALAIADRGRIVYARGIGFANKASRDPVQPNSLFRIASLTKPITAVAILQLVESSQLGLNDSVHTLLKLDSPKDSRWRTITVQHLLNHTGGWDRDKSFDGMFVPYEVAKFRNKELPVNHLDVIQFMLQQQLDFEPGKQFAYSNFGYCLLGRIIETITGQPYAEYVQQNIFRKLGLERPRIGKSPIEQRAVGEVTYYDEQERTVPSIVGNVGTQVPIAYGGFDVSMLDSHGGWIASAIDLVKFASDLPLRTSVRQSTLLRRESIDCMDTPLDERLDLESDGKPKKVRYGMGWNLRDLGSGHYNAWHTGELNATSAIMVRRSDDKCWVALFNARVNSNGEYLAGIIDSLIHRAVDSVQQWPNETPNLKWLK